MKNINEGIIFYTRAGRFSTIDVWYKNEETSTRKAALARKSEKWMGCRISRIRIGVITAETKPGCVVAAFLEDTNNDNSILEGDKAQEVNWWVFGLEICLATPEGSRNSHQIVSYDDKVFNIVIERRPPLCYRCRQMCHLVYESRASWRDTINQILRNGLRVGLMS